MKYSFLLLCFLISLGVSAQKKDSVLFVLIISQTQKQQLYNWIQSSNKHSGSDCQDYIEFLEAHTKLVENKTDSTKKKK